MPSTVIRKAEYDSKDRVLTITFVSGSVYEYLEVPEQKYVDMIRSFSKGIYYNDHIKDQYEFRRVQ